MPKVSVRIPVDAYERAKRLAAAEAQPTAQIADYHESLRRLSADPVAAAEEQAEIEAWDAASLADMHASIGDDW